MTPVRVLSLRPADPRGSGDSARAASIVAALRDGGETVRPESLLAAGESLRAALANWRSALALARGVAVHGHDRPLQWLVVQALAARRPPADEPLPTVYVTSRVAPLPLPPGSAVDFVDSLASNARRRAADTGPTAWFWRREARLLSSTERSLAATARIAVAVSAAEAALIGPRVLSVPLAQTVGERARSSRATAGRGSRPTVLFAGNLYYSPNHEAAMWMVTRLLPDLVRRGWRPDQVVVAGRRPSRTLRATARRSGATLLADVPDLGQVVAAATVSIAPMRLGGGVQTKVLDSLAAGTPTVLTAHANRGLDLTDCAMVRVVPRTPKLVGDAIEDLLSVDPTGALPAEVRRVVEACAPAAVQECWRRVLAPVGQPG